MVYKSSGNPSLRVLVADDIESSRNDLCALVRQFGHEVIEADSGRRVMEVIESQLVDIVLLDLLMPDLDGFEVTRRIRALHMDRWLPVVVTSALEGDEPFEQALRNGADDCLTRPVSGGLLDAKLKLYGRVLGMQSRMLGLAQRQRATLDNMLDVVVVANEAGVVEDANRAACELFGAESPQGLLGRRMEALTGMAMSQLVEAKEVALLGPGDLQRQFEVAGNQWREGAQTFWTIVLHDLSQQRMVERMKNEFLSTVSHELRTPLTAVVGALGLVAAGAAGPLPEAAASLAAVAQRNAQRLSRLIDDVLELTKLEADKLTLNTATVALAPLLREATAALQDHARQCGVELALVLPAEPLEVTLDQDRFLQIMANLLSNAIKHAPKGTQVDVSADRVNERVQVRVRDHGPGIAPSFRARMFEKFSQADSSDRRAQGGTGLGLHITKLLTERMGGTIAVLSTPGLGAEFLVEFPMRQQLAVQHPRWVLHVDADADSRDRLSRWLDPMCQVVSAATVGSVDLAQVGSCRPIVVADPASQGQVDDFCRSLGRLTEPGRIILYTDSLDAQFAQESGLYVLRKSRTTEADLVAKVRDIFRHSD